MAPQVPEAETQASKKIKWKQGYHNFLADEKKVLEYVQKQEKSTNQRVDQKQDSEELKEFKEYLR